MGTQPPLQPGYVMADLFGSPSPAGTPSFAHGCQISTLNAPIGPSWTVSGNIPNITDLLGVDLGNQFSAEADERRGDRRRNPDRQARRWERPCGTSSRHNTHDDDDDDD